MWYRNEGKGDPEENSTRGRPPRGSSATEAGKGSWRIPWGGERGFFHKPLATAYVIVFGSAVTLAGESGRGFTPHQAELVSSGFTAGIPTAWQPLSLRSLPPVSFAPRWTCLRPLPGGNSCCVLLSLIEQKPRYVEIIWFISPALLWELHQKGDLTLLHACTVSSLPSISAT